MVCVWGRASSRTKCRTLGSRRASESDTWFAKSERIGHLVREDGGRVEKSPSLRQIGYNSAEVQKEENGGYLRNLRQITCTTVVKLRYMYIHVYR